MTRPYRAVLLVLLSLFSSAALAAGIELAPRAVAPTAYWTTLPRTASAGDRVLTVWREQMDELGMHVKGAIADANGTPITTPAFTIAKHTAAEWMDVVGTGDSFAVFWRERDVTSMADVDRDGRVTRTRTIDVPLHIAGKAAWNGTHLLLAIRAGGFRNEATAVMLERDGDVVRRDPIDAYGSYFEIVPAGDAFLVFTSGMRLVAQRVTADGVTTTRQLDGNTSPGTSPRPLEVVAAPASNGTLLVWAMGGAGPQSELRSAILPHEGGSFDIRVLKPQADGVFTPLALLRDGDGHALLYSMQVALHARSRLTTARLDANGALAGAETAGPELDAPDVTTNGNAFFVAGHTAQNFLPRVSSIIVRRDGTASAPQMLSLAYSRQHQPILGAGNGRILGLFSEHQGDFASIRSALLTPDGVPSPRPAAALSFLTSRDLAWNGTDYLAVHRSNDKLMATRVDENGVAIDQNPIVIASMDTHAWWEHVAAVSWVGTQWMVVWPDEANVYVSFVSPGGVATAPHALAVGRPPAENTYRAMSDVALAFDGTNALLVWNEAHHEICFFPVCGNGEARTYATRLMPDGEVVDAAPLELPRGDAHSIATRGRQFVVATGTTVSLLDARDALTLVTTRTLPGISGLSDVTFDGRGFLVAVRYRVANWHLRLHRLGTTLADQDVPRGVMTPAPDRFTPPSIAALDAQSVLIGTQEGDPETGPRAVVYRDDDLQPLPAPPAPPVNVRTTWSPGAHLTTWDAPPGSVVEQYVVEERHPEGFLWSVRYVDGDTRSAITTYEHVRIIARNAGGSSDDAVATPLPRRRAARK